MNRAYTDLLKFLCCLLIFLRHFYGGIWTETFGVISCTLFFFFSAYGITLSQIHKNLSLLSFIKSKLIRIWLPLLLTNVVTLLFIRLYTEGWNIPHFIRPFNYSAEVLFPFILYLFDIYMMDPVTWFLHELIVAYVFIWGLLRIKIQKKRILTAFLLYIGWEFVFFYFGFKDMYKIETVGILAGLVYAHYKDVFGISLQKMHYIRIISLLVVILSIVLYYKIGHGKLYILLSIAYSSACILAVIAYSYTYNNLNDRYNIYAFLSSVSFPIYLIHNKYCASSNELGVLTVFSLTFLSAIILFFLNNFVVKVFRLN